MIILFGPDPDRLLFMEKKLFDDDASEYSRFSQQNMALQICSPPEAIL